MSDHGGILLVGGNAFHNGTSDDDSIRHLRYLRGILGCRHAKPNGYGSGRDFLQFTDVVLDILDVAQLRSRNAPH